MLKIRPSSLTNRSDNANEILSKFDTIYATFRYYKTSVSFFQKTFILNKSIIVSTML